MRHPREVVRSILAAAALLLLLIGVPWLLAWLVGWPLPTTQPSWDEVSHALLRGDITSWTLIKALSIAVWLAWVYVVTATVIEASALIRGRAARRLPGPRTVQLAVTNLITAASLLVSGGARAATAPDDVLAVPSLATALISDGSGGHAPTATPAPDAIATNEGADHEEPSDGHRPRWMVRPRETLWEIAEEALGDGLRWREIRELNVGRRQPDGGMLQPDGELVRPGWELVLPPDAELPTDRASATDEPPSTDAIEIQRGDTLWDLSEEHLGDPRRWPTLYEANEGLPQDDGHRLSDPDLIRPGWILRLPTDGTAPAGNADSADGTQTSEHNEPGGQPPDGAHPQPRPDAGAHPGSEQSDRTDPAPGRPASPSSPSPRETAGPGTTNDGDVTEGSAPTGWLDEAAIAMGFGLAAAGFIATLDRIRRTRRRRRRPGQRIHLPEGELAAAEQRVRSIADPSAAHLLQAAITELSTHDPALGSRLVLMSMSAGDVAAHLTEPAREAPEGWVIADGGMTWIRPCADLDTESGAILPEDALTPVLGTVGTTAQRRRRVMLNLRHHDLLRVDAQPEPYLALLRSLALELATATSLEPIRIACIGFGHELASLERITTHEDTAAAVDHLANHAKTAAGDPATETVVALFAIPPDEEAQDVLPTLVEEAAGRIVAIAGAATASREAELRRETDGWVLEPEGVEIEPLMLSDAEISRLVKLMDEAKTASHRNPPAEDQRHADEESETSTSPEADADPPAGVPEARSVDVAVLGPVEVCGADEFETAKSQELVVYLAMHRHGADTDTLLEALWPGQAPNPHRIRSAISRARNALGRTPDGDTYLPRADKGRYRLIDDASLDYERFRQLVSAANPNSPHAEERLREALELIRGRPFEANSTEYAWAANDIHAIQQEIVDVAHRLAELALEAGRPADAVWAAERGLQADNFAEILYRDLMRAAAAQGNTAHVHSAMTRLRKKLSDDADANDADDWLDDQTIALYARLTETALNHGSGTQTSVATHEPSVEAPR